MNISFTIDLEDPTERYERDGRYVKMAQRILDFCECKGVKATFFTIGRVAIAAPVLVKEIAKRGHEVAYHSHNHVSLTVEDPKRFRSESSEDKDRFEQITGQSLVGFRAPRFSLTPKSTWALEELAQMGFEYSSSIMPTDISLFGFPDAPTSVFKWPCGLGEFPLPVALLGKYKMPYLGGIYLYSLPFFLVKKMVRASHPNEALWTYTHPYDFDSTEKFSLMPHTPAWVSAVLWFSRRNAASKIEKVMDLGAGMPLRERWESLNSNSVQPLLSQSS